MQYSARVPYTRNLREYRRVQCSALIGCACRCVPPARAPPGVLRRLPRPLLALPAPQLASCPPHWKRKCMSSAVSLARDCVSAPTVPSKTSRFLSCGGGWGESVGVEGRSKACDPVVGVPRGGHTRGSRPAPPHPHPATHLQRDDALLDRALDDEPHGGDGAVLAEPVGAVEGLELCAWEGAEVWGGGSGSIAHHLSRRAAGRRLRMPACGETTRGGHLRLGSTMGPARGGASERERRGREGQGTHSCATKACHTRAPIPPPPPQARTMR